MDSQSHPSSKRLTDAPDPRDDPNLIRTFAGFRQTLAAMSIDQLMELAAKQGAELQAQSQSTLTALISSPLSDSLAALDRAQVRSLPTAHQPSRPDRGSAASQPSVPPRPSALDLLAKSKHLAPRIAAKLVSSEARRARAERESA